MQRARIVVAAVVTALAIAALLAYGDYRAYAAGLAEAQYWRLWPLLFIAPAAQVVRAYRLSVLLEPTPSAFDAGLFSLASRHMLFSSVLPLRTGDLALPVLLKVQRKVLLSTGLGYVLLVRTFDLLVLLTFCGLGALIVAPDREWRIVFAVASVASTGVLVALPSLAATVRRLAADSLAEGAKARTIVEGLAEGAAALRDRGRWMRMWLSSVLVWAFVFLTYYISSSAVAEMAPLTVLLAGGAASFAGAQPVNGVAGLGVVQAAWAWTAHQLGVDWNAAVASGIVVHLAQIAGVAFSAAIAEATMWLAGGRARARALRADAGC